MRVERSQTAPEANILPSRDIGTHGRALLRVAGRKTGENRWVRAFYSAGSITLRSVGRVLHVLWLEVTGLFFLVLAVVGGAAAVREYHRHQAGTGSIGKMWVASVFAVLFVYFGITSFLRSRARSRR
jgi:hypothetical protein